jgi:DNA (cytosine-5)-methyltransferase 1
VRVGALCAGYGGLELGLSLTGVDVDLTWYAEINKHAAQVMGHHHPDVPNLVDLTEITDPPRVDVVTAGFPCQPVSIAGKRKGVKDERWLIEDVCRVAWEAGAEWLILENVAGLRSANGGDAMARVVSALAGNGFGAEWTSVRASDVGAPHGRLRWFCLAYAENGNADLQAASGVRIPFQSRGVDFLAAYADSGRYGAGQDGGRVGRVDGSDEGGTREREWSRSVVGDRSHETAADAGRFGAQVPAQRGLSTVEESGSVGPQGRTDFGPYADAVARWEPIVGRPAPDPTDDKRRLNPRFVEWMMGLPDGWVTDAGVTRSQALKILGNGVVPQQAALALRLLSEQAVAA